MQSSVVNIFQAPTSLKIVDTQGELKEWKVRIRKLI